MDALEEDELEACSSSRPELFHFYTPTVQEMSSSDSSFVPVCAAGSPGGAGAGDYFCFLQVPAAEPGVGPAGQGEPEPALQPRLSGLATPGCHSHSELVLRPPPGFGDSSSEEEFYDAADRLSPPDTLAGKSTPGCCRCSLPGLTCITVTRYIHCLRAISPDVFSKSFAKS